MVKLVRVESVVTDPNTGARKTVETSLGKFADERSAAAKLAELTKGKRRAVGDPTYRIVRA